MLSIHNREITFGDCDPAGIVFYPNVFRWMDAAFHEVLHRHGGHAALCERLGMVGLGLVDASARFHHPMRDGDRLALHLSVAQWSARSLTLAYAGKLGETTAFTGQEVRCMFLRGPSGMVAGDMARLRAVLEAGDDR